MKCFYHSSDLDGHCSGAIVKYRYPNCELIGINYGDEFSWDSIEPGEVVYMVDFSLQPFVDMQKLAQIAKLTWIDHHISAIKEFQRQGLGAALVVAIDGEAGCELTWQYVYYNLPMPKLVRALGRYDVWDHSDLNTLPIQYGMRLENTDPENQSMWRLVLENYVSFYRHVLKRGRVVLEYVQQENEKYAKACAFEIEFDGMHCIAVNRMLTNSQTFDSVWDPDVYDAMLTFGWRKGHWGISLYSTKENVDVSEIAKARGGGGHKGAAGFQCQKLPFDLK
jgi:oligoribonuclease NrnB/cAMP/cGMP phosphodiesterase (DHH superfamily)